MMLMRVLGPKSPKGTEAERRLAGRVGGYERSDCSHGGEDEDFERWRIRDFAAFDVPKGISLQCNNCTGR